MSDRPPRKFTTAFKERAVLRLEGGEHATVLGSYISNPKDAAFIDSREGRERIAQSVRRAVDIHFARRLASND